MLRRVAARVLRRAGYHVLEANDAEGARKIAEASSVTIDALVTDVVMPKLSGPDMVHELKRHRPGLRVLYMSGYASSAMHHPEIVGAGARFLEKPFTTEALLDRVHETLHGAR
jgi:DNA-binding NtrC family response regulator